LRIAGGGHDQTRACGAHRLDRLEAHGVEQFGPCDAVIEQHGLAGAQARATQDLLGRAPSGFADERERVTAGGPVERERAVLRQQLEGAREGLLSGVRHHVVGQAAAGLAAHLGKHGLALPLPAGNLGGALRHHREGLRPARITAVDRAGGTVRGDECGTLRARHQAHRGEPVARSALHGLEAGARGSALDEQRASRLDLQGGEQRTHHRAEVQHIRTGGLEREVGGQRVQLRALHEQELLVAAGVGLVALDREARVHRVPRGERRQQVALTGVHRDQIADLEPAFALHLAAQRGDQRHAARTSDLVVEVVVLERRHRDAGDRPDVVEVHLGGEHVDHCLGGAGARHGQQDLALHVLRQAVRRRPGVRILDHRMTVLPLRKGRQPGIERRAHRQQFTAAHERRQILCTRRDRAARRQRRALFLEEGADPGLAARRIHHRLGEQLGLARQPRPQPCRPAGPHRVEDASGRRATPHGFGLRQQAPHFRIDERGLQWSAPGAFPFSVRGDARGELPGHQPGALRRRQVLGREAGRQGDHVFVAVRDRVQQPVGEQRVRVVSAPAEDDLERAPERRGVPGLLEQARQPLRAAVARQQVQAHLGLAEAGRGLRHPHMAGHRELHATAERHAVDRGDRRLVHGLELAEGQVRVVGQRQRLVQRMHVLEQLPDVRARNEGRRALAGEHHGPDVVAPRHVVDDDVQLVERALVERVHRRVGHRDQRDAPALERVVVDAEVAEVLEQLLLIGDTLPRLPLGDGTAQFADRLRVAQRRGVTDVLALDQCAHHAPHVLAAAGLGELRHLDEVLGDRDLALLLADGLDEATAILGGQLAPGRGPHEGERGQALLRVRRADHDHVAHRRIGIDLLVAQDRALDLFGAEPVTRDIDDVVGAAMQREPAVGVLHGEVALRIGEPALPAQPVGPAIALEVAAPGARDRASLDLEVRLAAPDRAAQVGIRCRDDDLALLAHLGLARQHPALRVGLAVRDPDVAHHPRQRIGMRIGAQREVSVAEQVRPDDATVLRGPVGVDVPGSHEVHAELLHHRRSRLGAESCHAQRRARIRAHVLDVLRVGHHGLQEGDTRLEDIDLVALDDAREAPGAREHRRALGDHGGHAGRERGADHVALARDPARVRDHVHDVAGTRIEGRAQCAGNAADIAAVHVHHALGLAGGPGGVDEKQREFRIQRLGRDGGPDGRDELAVGQREQFLLARDRVPRGAGRLQQRLQGGVRQFVRPAITLRTPQQVGLRRVPHDDDRVDPRRRRDQRGSDGRADPARLGRRDAGQTLERAAHPAHDIRALEGDLAGDRGTRALEDGPGLARGQRQRMQRALHRHECHLRGHVAVQRRVGIGLLEGHDLRVAVTAVRGDDHARAGVVDAIRQRLVAEAAEHGRVHHADALAGLGPEHLLRDVRHVDGEAVARPQPEPAQRQRATRGLQQQLLARHGIRDHGAAPTAVERLVPTVPFEPQRHLVAVPGKHVAIDFVEAGVGQRAAEPAVERCLARIERRAPGAVIAGQVRRDRGAAAGVVPFPGRVLGDPADPGAVRAQ